MKGKKFRKTITIFSKEDKNLCYAINKDSEKITLTIECVDGKSYERGKHNGQEKAAFQGGERDSLHIGGRFLSAGYCRTDRNEDSGEIQVSPGKISFEPQKRYLPSTSKGRDGDGAFGTDRRKRARYDGPDNGTNAGRKANTGESQKHGYVAMGRIDEQLQRIGAGDSDARLNLSGRTAGRDGGYGIRRHRSGRCFQVVNSIWTQSGKKHDKECIKETTNIYVGDVGARPILKWGASLAFSPFLCGRGQSAKRLIQPTDARNVKERLS